MNIKLMTKLHLESLSLKGGCTGSSESTLVKMPHCWKSHVTAQIFLFLLPKMIYKWNSLAYLRIRIFNHLNTGLDKQIFQRKNVNIFLLISINICFGCSKEPSH